MKQESKGSDHLIRNLERITSENSIFNYKSGRKAFLSLGQGDIREWMEKLSRDSLQDDLIPHSLLSSFSPTFNQFSLLFIMLGLFNIDKFCFCKIRNESILLPFLLFSLSIS